MTDNNKNPRRTIWLSETEPLSHYDIWLSKNQHLNSDGEPLSVSGVLRPCDYIFKVWDCDNWYPIIGFNSTAVNKIDTVWNTDYTDSLEIFHSGHYREFNVPLFTRPGNSPSELFNGGTVGNVILKYVSDSEWELIILHIYETSSIENPYTLQPASSSNLGGIKANTLNSFDSGVVYGYIEERNNNENRYHIALTGEDIYSAISVYLGSVDPNNPNLPDFNLWLAEEHRTGGIRAKALKHDTSSLVEVGFLNTTNINEDDYGRLFVNSQEVVAVGIELATPQNIGGIKAHTSNISSENLIEVKFSNSDDPNGEDYGFLYVNPAEITGNSFNNPEFISELLWTAFENSPSIKKDWTTPTLNPELASKPRFSIYGANDIVNNGGKFLRLKTEQEISNMTPPPYRNEPYDETYNNLDWVDINDYLGITGGTAIEIENGKVNLRFDSWSFNVTNDENELLLKPATTGTLGGIIVGDNLTIDLYGRLSASPSLTQELNVIEGTGIKIEQNPSNLNERRISINTDNGLQGYVLTFGSNNTVEWKEVQLSSSTSYNSGIGINIDNNTINIDLGEGDNSGKYLKVNSAGNDVEWATIPSGGQYSEGKGININSNVISQNIEQNNDSITVSTPNSITIEDSDNNSITITIKNSQNTEQKINVGIYEYIDLSDYADVEYNFSNIPISTNPIYLKIKPKAANVTIGNGIEYTGDYTSIQTTTNPYLVTIQFGIIKFEEINTYTSLP